MFHECGCGDGCMAEVKMSNTYPVKEYPSRTRESISVFHKDEIVRYYIV
jgi:hypothetical protein